MTILSKDAARYTRLAPVFVISFVITFVAAPGAQAPAAPKAIALGWMVGSWAGTADGVETEEHWTAPRGGSMLGMHRDVTMGRMVSFEFLRIEEQNGKLVYLASPKGVPPTPFTAVELGATRVVFENPTHDFPQRILYWKDGTDLMARIEGKQGTRDAHMQWRWKPSTLAARGDSGDEHREPRGAPWARRDD